MALMVNFGVVACWKVRGLVEAAQRGVAGRMRGPTGRSPACNWPAAGRERPGQPTAGNPGRRAAVNSRSARGPSWRRHGRCRPARSRRRIRRGSGPLTAPSPCSAEWGLSPPGGNLPSGRRWQYGELGRASNQRRRSPLVRHPLPSRVSPPTFQTVMRLSIPVLTMP